MANWSGFTLTDVGADLQAKINAGLTTLKFTKVGVGSGSGSGSGFVNALTAMVHKEQDIGIGNVEANGNIVTINFTLTNKGLGSAYQMRELGLYATDPDNGEVLFAYMTDSTPDTMPADGSATVVSQAVTLNIAFSNKGNVSATIDTGAFVTQEDLEAHEKSITAHSALMAGHNTDETAHSDIINAHNTDTTAHQPILDMISSNQTTLTETDDEIKSVLNTLLGTDSWDTPATNNIASIINLLGFGGIVAQRLESDGYIKFANGLIIQWGATSNNISTAFGSKATLPIAFVKPLIAVGSLLNLGGVESEKNFDDKIILTSTQIAFKYFGHSYIAIGLA